MKLETVTREIASADFHSIQSILKESLEPFGFESTPLLIKWYNDQVAEKFKFSSIDENSLAFCVVSVGWMFEKGFLPFVFGNECRNPRNALDESIEFYLNGASSALKNFNAVHYKDSDMAPGTRRPAFLAQPAAHVSGTAFYYHPSEIITAATDEGVPLPWGDHSESKSGVFGVSIHPKYGGWFAVRALIILRNVVFPELPFNPPVDIVKSTHDKLRLLHEFNFNNWKNWKYRDIIPVEPEMKYSKLQRKYFETEPKLRLETLQSEMYQEFVKLQKQ
ncbi:cyanocobalamin reductase / alkylcobalamin dealkylase-like [Convolutriloba macropyga]|uniref:cyanocobalamin reductase / alkylcobalamin dealkylase-like n=1 Tax=Convolutriloba macropyga TaxID=536237 RepID=UPI003F52482A